jgi:hypothetical protein
MPVLKQAILVNQLLAGLPAATRKAILTRCETIDLKLNTSLCERGELYGHVYFPLSGFLSMATLVSGHPPIMPASRALLGVTSL